MSLLPTSVSVPYHQQQHTQTSLSQETGLEKLIQGSYYCAKRNSTTFVLSTGTHISAVDVLVFDSKDSTSHSQHFEMQSRGSQFVKEVINLQPGTHYAFKLYNAQQEVIAAQVADPYAYAETSFKWLEHKDGFIDRVRRAQQDLAEDGIVLAHPKRFDEFLQRIGRPSDSDFEAPKSIVIDPNILAPKFPLQSQPHKLGERIICKYHPLHSHSVADAHIGKDFRHLRGTIDVLACPIFRNYLKKRWNTIEFFPLNNITPCAELFAQGKSPVWGYMPSQFFALHGDYFHSDEPHEQIKTLQDVVSILKSDGFSVLMDIVPFHTGEKRDTGPRYSLRALNEDAYFLKDADGNFADVSGCGNTLNIFNPEIQQLILEQSRYLVSTFGVDRRIDQAAIAHLPHDNIYGFDPDSNFANELYGISPCIIELGHAGGLFQRKAAALRVMDDVAQKDFSRRNLSDIDGLGYSFDIFEGVARSSTAAFIQAGRVGGYHPSQIQNPLEENRGVSVFPHDGPTPYDSAELDSVLLLSKLLPASELASSVRDAIHKYQSFDDRRAALLSCLPLARKELGAELKRLQINRTRMRMANLYLSTGDILCVFGDHKLRTQNGNSNAYDCERSLKEAIPSPENAAHACEQESLSKLIGELVKLRNEHEHIFKNINIFDGSQASSKNNTAVTHMRWYGKNAKPLSEKDWLNGKTGHVRFFLGAEYVTERLDGSKSQLYIASSRIPRTITLPALEHDGLWKRRIDSSIHASTNTPYYEAGGTYELRLPAVTVFESKYF